MRYHRHLYSGVTSFDNGHVHAYGGRSSKAPSGVPHAHYIDGATSFDDGHIHYYMIETGPDIPVAGGGHIHYIKGITEVANDHVHCMDSPTSAD